jgi:putative transposase
VVDNVLNRDFAPDAPNKVWVTDITYIRTYEGLNRPGFSGGSIT